MRQALDQAHAGAIHSRQDAGDDLGAARGNVEVRAAGVEVKINPEKIGLVIGPGGKNIRGIQEETNTKIDIQDDGTVSITSSDPAGAERAVQRIRA